LQDAPNTAPPGPLPLSLAGYRIGLISAAGEPDCAYLSLQSAAARLNHSIVPAIDAAELNSATVDFILATAPFPTKPENVPVFRIIREAKAGFWDNDEWLADLARFDGYLTISDSLRRFLANFCRVDETRPCIGAFELTPERQFTICKLKKIISLGAFRLCHLAAPQDGSLLQHLEGRPYLRLDRAEPNDDPGGRTTLPTRARSAQTVFAAFGAGLVVLGKDHEMDAAAFYRLCEIVSVGAIALCPDIPWIRRHFEESVHYYPRGDPAAATEAIDRAIDAIVGDPAGAAARAQAARSIFEENFAAEVMLQNAVGVFQEWRARVSLPQPSTPVGRTVVDTDGRAIEAVFARLPAKTLAVVGRTVAELGPLEPMPHWRFGGFADSSDLAVHVRHSLWRAGKARGGVGPIVMPWHAGTRLNLFLDNDLSLTLFAGGAFEPNEFALLNRVLRPGMVFLDGGANEGAYTVFAAARVGPKGRVIAVEPSLRELERLKANLALNRQRNVEIVEAALTDRSGSARLLIAEPTHAGQNTLGEFAYAISAAGEAEVGTITLDELVQEQGLSRLDILKLDIEGAELRALSAAWGCLGEMRPLILAEVSDEALTHQGGSAAALLQLLEDADYVALTFDDETGDPIPLGADNRSLSDNIVAVHRDRDWGLLAGADIADAPRYTRKTQKNSRVRSRGTAKATRRPKRQR
jgi:FkbM family methyltransferase